jgi:hypothetical protein
VDSGAHLTGQGAVESGAQLFRLWATLPFGGPTNGGRGYEHVPDPALDLDPDRDRDSQPDLDPDLAAALPFSR